MIKFITLLTLMVAFTGCVYDPVNYAKQHDRDFNDHLYQMGDGGDGGGGDE